eukprot:403330787
MTINCEVYQKILEKQSSLNERESGLYRQPAIKLWKAIMKGDLTSVKKLLLNPVSGSQSANSQSLPNSNHSSNNFTTERNHGIYSRYGSVDVNDGNTCHHLFNQKSSTPLAEIASGSTLDQGDQINSCDVIGAKGAFANSYLLHNNFSNSALDLQSNQQQKDLLSSDVNLLLVERPLNKYGWTALHSACYFGHLEIVQFLTQHCEADVNAINSNGWHSLIFAIFGGHLDIIDYLLYETEVNEDLLDIQERSALKIAQQINDSDVLDLLREKTENQFSFEGSGCEKSHFNSSYESLLRSLEEY